MPIHSKTNLYPGINAHLNSFLQQEGGGWESFHAEHIIDLRRVLAAALPVNYYCVVEQSAYYADDMAVIVYWRDKEAFPGRAIVRIELLSPHNKSPHVNSQQHQAKLHSIFNGDSDIVLIEIDYLHETPPINKVFKDHGITVFIPRPNIVTGEAIHNSINFHSRLPKIAIPLIESDAAILDLPDAYHRTYESEGFFDIIVDYAADPVNFDRYTSDDQMKIRALLDTIRREHADE